MWRKPSANCSAGSASTCSPGRRRHSIIADDSVDGEICATDLLGQAEHGPSSPAILLTNSEKLAQRNDGRSGAFVVILPTAEIAGKAWKDYGEVIVCGCQTRWCSEADRIASEHVQVMTRDPDCFLEQHEELRLVIFGAEHQRRLRR